MCSEMFVFISMRVDYFLSVITFHYKICIYLIPNIAYTVCICQITIKLGISTRYLQHNLWLGCYCSKKHGNIIVVLHKIIPKKKINATIVIFHGLKNFNLENTISFG